MGVGRGCKGGTDGDGRDFASGDEHRMQCVLLSRTIETCMVL